MRNPRNESITPDSSGMRGEGEGPERRCILTSAHAPRDALVRLALSPDGDVLPDVLARAPGRGAWIGVDKGTLAAAQRSGKLTGALIRAFKGTRPRLPDNLPEMVEDALRRAVLQRLGLEMRAGRLILGSDRIDREARTGRVAALYHAADASVDGSRKLDQALRVGSDAEGTGLAGEVLPLDRAALSVALGRENVVHLALADQASAERLALPVRRLQSFVRADPGIDPGVGDNDRAADDAVRAHAAS